MAKEGRSAEPRGSSQQQRPEHRSKLKAALASTTVFIRHFPQKLRRISSSLRAGPRHSHHQSSSSATTTANPPASKAMSTTSLQTASQGRHQHGPGPMAGSDTPVVATQPGGPKGDVIPLAASLVAPISRLSLADTLPSPKNLAIQPPNPPGRTEEERQTHQHFTNEALEMARLALRTNETPVGCVLVHNGTIIAKGMNATNVTRNGTRHAEFMALAALLARQRKDRTGAYAANGGLRGRILPDGDAESSDAEEDVSARGHLYPYGQKFYPDEVVDKSIVNECVLYVTVEPCVMCASLLRQLGISKVFFGAVNDKFGGTGGVFSIHKNASPSDGEPDAPQGHGGNIEPGYYVEGGWGRDEAVALLRRFYVQENGRAPVPRKKEGRAARLAALERDANGSSITSTVPETGEPVTAPESVVDDEESGPANETESKSSGPPAGVST